MSAKRNHIARVGRGRSCCCAPHDMSRARSRLVDSARADSARISEPASSSRVSLRFRPEWDESPLRHPPSMLKGINPKTKEPWSADARADLAIRMEFGSRQQLVRTRHAPLALPAGTHTRTHALTRRLVGSHLKLRATRTSCLSGMGWWRRRGNGARRTQWLNRGLTRL